MGGNCHSSLGMDPVDDVLQGKALWEVSRTTGKSKDEEVAFCTVILETPNKEKSHLTGENLQGLATRV